MTDITVLDASLIIITSLVLCVVGFIGGYRKGKVNGFKDGMLSSMTKRGK